MTAVGDDDIGRALGGGRFVLEARLGRGGMGAVYRARDTVIGAHLAVKLLHPSLATEERHVARFRREAEVTASLAHPHIVRTRETGVEADGTQWIAMELLEGKSLSETLRDAGGTLDTHRAISIARQILSALSATHAIGVVHRDLKPANVVMVSGALGATSAPSHEIAKVVDFGIARFTTTATYAQLTRTGQVVGTPTYMAPEQALGQRVHARADLFAVGAILHTMLVGEPPYGRGGYGDILERLLTDARVPLREQRPDLGALATLVDRALAPLPDDRPETAEAFDAELAELDPRSTTTVVAWRPPSTLARLRLPEELALDDVSMPGLSAPTTPNDARVATGSLAPAASRAPAPAAAPAPAPKGTRSHRSAYAIAAVLLALAVVMGVLALERLRPGEAVREGERFGEAPMSSTPMGDEPSLSVPAPVTPVSAALAAAPDSPPSAAPEATGGDAGPRSPHARRARRQRVVVRYSGHESRVIPSDVVRDVMTPLTTELTACWPRGETIGFINTGRSFTVTVGRDGSVIEARGGTMGAGTPAFVSCVERIIGRARFTPPSTGEPVTLRIEIHVVGQPPIPD